MNTALPLGLLGHDRYCVTANLCLNANSSNSEPKVLRLLLILPDSKQIDTIIDLRANFVSCKVTLTGWAVKPQLRYTNTDTDYWLHYSPIDKLLEQPITVISECTTAFLIKSISIESPRGPVKQMKFNGHTYLTTGDLTQTDSHKDFELDPLKALFFHSESAPQKRKAKSKQPLIQSVLPASCDLEQIRHFLVAEASEPGDLHLYELINACHPYDLSKTPAPAPQGSADVQSTAQRKGSGNQANIKPRTKYTPPPTLHTYASQPWESLHDLPSGEHTGSHLAQATMKRIKPPPFHALLEDEYDLD